MMSDYNYPKMRKGEQARQACQAQVLRLVDVSVVIGNVGMAGHMVAWLEQGRAPREPKPSESLGAMLVR